MPAMPTPERLRVRYPTQWSVRQRRSGTHGDTDWFTRIVHDGDDWVDLRDGGRLNLGHVERVHLTFGTFATPNYAADIYLVTGERQRVYGEDVMRLQHELLRRTVKYEDVLKDPGG